MAFTLSFSTARWETQLSILTQMEYRPRWQSWRNDFERGCLLKFLCFTWRFGAGSR